MSIADTAVPEVRRRSRDFTTRLFDERVVLAVFVLLIIVAAVRHEPWRDEWQAWLIARDSGSLGELLTNGRFEGHPPLWYLILWVTSWISRDVFAMQLVNAAIATAVAATILWRAPFTRPVRVALVFGYFPLYQYGTIARSYGLSLLLVLLVCVEASRLQRRALVLSGLLGAMMLTSPHAFLVAVALGAAIVLDEFLERSQGGLVTRRALRPSKPFIGGVVVTTLCAAWAVSQMAPPSDGSFGVGFNTASDARTKLPNFGQVAVAALIGDGTTGETPVVKAMASVVGLVIVVVLAWNVRNRLAALTLWLGGTALLMGFAWLRFRGSIRHMGYFFMIGLATFWLKGRFVETSARREPGALSRAMVATGVVVVLTAQITFGAAAWLNDVFRPYSATAAAADWIHDHGLADATLIGYPDFATAGVGGHLDRPMLYLEQDRLGTFVLWRNDRQPLTESAVVTAAAERARSGAPVVLVTRYPLQTDLGPLRLEAEFTDTIVDDEQMYVYVAAES